MDTAQVCDRLLGQETCPLHKGHNISTLCKTCGILVCLKCITSAEHEGHTFKEITSCLREPTDNLAKHIREIENKLLIAVKTEISERKKQRTKIVQKHTKGIKQIKEQSQKAHLQIDANANSMVIQWDEHSQQVLDVLDKHILGLESIQNQLNVERKECSEILEKGSNVLKYDAGLEITKKTEMQRIPKAPEISDLDYINCDHNFNELLLKAMGTLKEVSSKPAIAVEIPDKYLASSSEMVKQHQYQLIESISNTKNELPGYAAITPIGKNSAWACHLRTYDERTKKYLYTDVLSLIDSKRNVIQQVKLDVNISNLQTHPITRQPFCITDKDNFVRTIDTTTGKTTNIFKCPKDLHRLKVTHDNHFITGTCGLSEKKETICKYKITGELLKESSQKYNAHDIDHCPQTNRVAISRGEEGLTLLNSDLTTIKTFNRKNMFCRSAIFNDHGNLIIGDYSNKEIIVVDGESLSYIQKLEIDGITRPGKLKLYDNILWIDCFEPDKLICVRIT